MIAALLPWLADALALLGLAVMTVSVYGILRLPDETTRIHAAGKVGVMGVLPLLLAAVVGSDTAVLLKAVLVGAFVILTSPIVAHEIGRAAYVAQHRRSSRE